MIENVHVKQWDSKTLDKVLQNGDWLYINNAPLKSYFPLISDLPRIVCILGRQFEIQITASYFGSFESFSQPFLSTQGALRKVEKYVILTIGTSTSVCSMSIIRDAENVFYVFDLHSRGENGLPASDGKAILTL